METAFELVDKDWHDYVTIDGDLMRPTDILRNKVDPPRPQTGLGWKAKSGMTEVVSMMLEAEITNLRKEGVGHSGQRVVQDANSSPMSCKVCGMRGRISSERLKC